MLTFVEADDIIIEDSDATNLNHSGDLAVIIDEGRIRLFMHNNVNVPDSIRLWMYESIQLDVSHASALNQIYDDYEKFTKYELKKIPVSKKMFSLFLRALLSESIINGCVVVKNRRQVIFQGIKHMKKTSVEQYSLNDNRGEMPSQQDMTHP